MSKVLTVQYNSFCSAQVQKILECHPLDCFWFRPISSDLWKWDAQTSMYTGRLHQAVNTTGMFEPIPSNNTSYNLTAFWPQHLPWSPSQASIAEGKISTSMWAKATGLKISPRQLGTIRSRPLLGTSWVPTSGASHQAELCSHLLIIS